MTATRRQLLGRSLGLAGAATLPGALLTAAPAVAQESDETDALEPIVELEQAAELGYSLAAEEGKPKRNVQEVFELFSEHAGDHATALGEALDQLDVDPPEGGSELADHERLSDFDPKADERELLDFMIALEEELIAAYEDAQPDLDAEDLVRSAGQIAASHAQMLVALRVLAGDKPIDLLPLP